MGKLILFKEILSCKECLYSWEGYIHGFSRGHCVLEKKGRFTFVPDDIWYLFPEGTDFDIELIFRKLGWRSIESCPKCKSNNIFPPIYDVSTCEEVDCEIVERKDFELLAGEWSLIEKAKEKYV